MALTPPTFNPPAFPTEETGTEGMTLRDYFAAAAMQGIRSYAPNTPMAVAEWAYEQADAMLKKRSKP